MQQAGISAEERKRLFQKLVATHPEAMCKGDTIPYTSLNGHMYSYLSKDGFVALKLPEDARKEFMSKYKTTLAVSYGITQKEYVVVPDTLLQKTNELKHYFQLSHQFAGNLKPKAAKSKKKG